ncbi:MAG: DNA primase catalytic subunit PriS [Thermoplasmata archaeon]
MKQKEETASKKDLSTPEIERKKINFILQRFKKYYVQTELFVEEIQMREFAFMFYGMQGMVRHIAFTPQTLKKFVVERVPSHIYYSSALYRKPDAKTMDEKGWLGADLIFDLDADHIPGSEKMSYPEMLNKVKDEFKKLVDGFLLDDFGFDEKDVKIVFSGGRGYHAHIAKECVRKLGTQERREIVDYIAGTGLMEGEKIRDIRESMNYIFDATIYSPAGSKKYSDTKPEFVKTKITYSLPPPDAHGWKKRMREGIISQLEIWQKMEKSAVVKDMMEVKGVGEVLARKLYHELFEKGKAKHIIERGNLSVFSDDKIINAFLMLIKRKLAPAISGETDEPVTFDIKRLIRLPYSLHGKTGFVVKEMTRTEFENFEPLRDAIPTVFTDEPVKINITKGIEIPLKGERFSLKEGTAEIPEFAAIFLLCSGRATLENT